MQTDHSQTMMSREVKTACCGFCTAFFYFCVAITIAAISGWQVSITAQESGESFAVAVVLAVITAGGVWVVSLILFAILTFCVGATYSLSTH